jgi:2-aminoadipate transaminase
LQQALDLVVRPSTCDLVVVADPAYVGALQLVRLAGAELVAVPSDDDGLDVDDLADRLARGLRPRLVYVVADFHNPTGATLPAARRQRLAELADRYGFLVVDDDPYGELRWGGPTLPPLRSCSDRVVTLGSFSKVLCPGLRAGYVVAPPDLRHDLVVIKQAADLHTSTLTQRVIHDIVARPGWLDAHIAELRPATAPERRPR